MFKHVLIPTDGSDLARKAIDAGIAMAKQLGAKVTVYHAIDARETRIFGDEVLINTAAMKELEVRLREPAEKYMAEVQKAAQDAGVACETLITHPSTPYLGIIEAANERKCDLIFMGSHGRGALASLAQGSTTHKVLSHTTIPVLVYR